jgi:hypothetical protein
MLGAGIIEEQEEIDEFPNGLTAHVCPVSPGCTFLACIHHNYSTSIL